MTIVRNYNKTNLYVGMSNYFFSDLHKSADTMVVSYICKAKNPALSMVGEVLCGNSFAEAEEICKKYFSDEFFENLSVEIKINPWNGMEEDDYEVKAS